MHPVGEARGRVADLRGDSPLDWPSIIRGVGVSVVWGLWRRASPAGGRGTKGLHVFQTVPQGPVMHCLALSRIRGTRGIHVFQTVSLGCLH